MEEEKKKDMQDPYSICKGIGSQNGTGKGYQCGGNLFGQGSTGSSESVFKRTIDYTYQHVISEFYESFSQSRGIRKGNQYGGYLFEWG